MADDELIKMMYNSIDLEDAFAVSSFNKKLVQRFESDSLSIPLYGDDYIAYGTKSNPNFVLDNKAAKLFIENLKDIDVLVFGWERKYVRNIRPNTTLGFLKVDHRTAPIRNLVEKVKFYDISDESVGIDRGTWVLLNYLCGDYEPTDHQLSMYSEVHGHDLISDRNKIDDYWRENSETIDEGDLDHLSHINEFFSTHMYYYYDAKNTIKAIREEFPEKRFGIIVPKRELFDLERVLNGDLEEPDWSKVLLRKNVVDVFDQDMIGKLRRTYEHIENALNRKIKIEFDSPSVVKGNFGSDSNK